MAVVYFVPFVASRNTRVYIDLGVQDFGFIAWLGQILLYKHRHWTNPCLTITGNMFQPHRLHRVIQSNIDTLEALELTALS